MEGIGALTEVCMKIFNNSSYYTNLFFPMLLLVRIAYANVTGSNTAEYTDTIKGAITYWMLVLGFPYLLDLMLMIPEIFAPEVSVKTVVPVQPTDLDLAIPTGMMPFYLRGVMAVITSFVYYAAQAIHFILMLVMCGIAPIVILFATMLGLGVGVKIFFGLMILASCWPILWAALDQFNQFIQVNGDGSFGAVSCELLIQIMKLIGPLWMSSMALKSGAGKALTGAATGAFKGPAALSSIIGGKGYGANGGSGAKGPANTGYSPQATGQTAAPGASRPTTSNAHQASISPTSRSAVSASQERSTQNASTVPSTSPTQQSTRQMSDQTANAGPQQNQGKASNSNQENGKPSANNESTSSNQNRESASQNSLQGSNQSSAAHGTSQSSSSNSSTSANSTIAGTTSASTGSAATAAQLPISPTASSSKSADTNKAPGMARVSAGASPQPREPSASQGTGSGNQAAPGASSPASVSQLSQSPASRPTPAASKSGGSDEGSDIESLAKNQMIADRARRKRG